MVASTRLPRPWNELCLRSAGCFGEVNKQLLPPPPAFLLDVAALATILRAHAIDADTDGDWLPDAVEAMLGTSSRSEDSDRDGRSDAEEDADHDRWPDVLEVRPRLGIHRECSRFPGVTIRATSRTRPAARQRVAQAATAAPGSSALRSRRTIFAGSRP